MKGHRFGPEWCVQQIDVVSVFLQCAPDLEGYQSKLILQKDVLLLFP